MAPIFREEVLFISITVRVMPALLGEYRHFLEVELVQGFTVKRRVRSLLVVDRNASFQSFLGLAPLHLGSGGRGVLIMNAAQKNTKRGLGGDRQVAATLA